jgi:type IV pilus assembly protein PilQ
MQAPPASVVVAAPAPTAQPPAAPAARRPIEVTGVEMQDVGPGSLVVVVTGDGPIATYESFMLPDPPRLVVDIPNAVHAVPQPITARPPLVAAVRSSQYRERPVQIVRVVMDLRSDMPFRAVAAQNQLRVELGTAEAAAAPTGATKAGPAAAPSPPAKAPGKVTRVDLQNARGRQQIIIRTSGRVTYSVTDSTDPLALTIDVAGATIEPAASRTVDLRQVSTPISRLRATQHQTDPDRVVRVTADLRGAVRYDVRQTPNAILVDFLPPPPAVTAAAAPVAPPVPAPAAPATASPPPAGMPSTGKLSMDFKDADINNLLRIIAEVSGMNVVAGGNVSGKVTVRLVNVEWQQALDVILRINGMGYEIDGNIIRVAPQAVLAAEQRAREEAKAREQRAREEALKAQRDQKKEEVALEPLRDEVISVNYAKATDVVKSLDRLKTPARPDASIAVDERTNKLIIRETAGSLVKMKELLRELDRATPQVLIEARLVEATRSFSQSLGIEWGFNAKLHMDNLQAGSPVSMFTSPLGTPLAIPAATGAMPLAISMPATSPTSAIGIIANSLFSNRLALGARISAGESENRVRTLSAPKVTTLDNQEAEIKQGSQVPYTTIDSSGRTVVAFQDAFIKLKVTPHITNDRRISMKVEAERSFPGDRVDFVGGFVFPINTRKATTQVLVSNGSTIVIGGLLQSDERWSESRIPWISKVPVLGSLFKSTSIGPEGKIELLIFLTPTILEEAKVS